MIRSLQEINDRFDKIKDHKPKASKKLNELGEILASAYKIDPELANEMWQYIVDLNTMDDVANSKFYVAQVFNKIAERLTAEEVTSLISMVPERVNRMVSYGYEGNKLWDCLDTLIHGYIKTSSVDDAAICVDYFYDKFDGIHSGRTEIYRIARKVAIICVEYIQHEEYVEESERLITILSCSDNQDVNSIVDITRIVGLSSECEDYDMLFYVTKKCKEPVEFFDLLWDAREQFSIEELRDKWVEYVEECEENEIRPYNYIRENDSEETIKYENSKLCFYVKLMKNEDILLDYYFGRSKLYDVEAGVVYDWIYENNWDYFIKYISQMIMASANSELDFSLKNTLMDFMGACFYTDGMDAYDKYGRSYKKLMKTRSSLFAEALVQISAITVGCNCHKGYHLFIKDYIQRLNGNVDLFNDMGFEEKEEKRSPFVQLKEYIQDFNNSGQKVHDRENMEYRLIMKQFESGVYTLSQKQENKFRNESYKMASDNMISIFFFTKCPEEYQYRKNMISACVLKNDVDQAIRLTDMMMSMTEEIGYNDLNGWGRQNMLTLKSLIQLYDYSKRDSMEHGVEGITDEMRQIIKQLIDRVFPILPKRSQIELKDELHKIEPTVKDAFEEYIDGLLKDVEIYTTFPKPRGKGKAPDINRVSSKIMASFKQLSENDKVDIIGQILRKFASVKEILRPVEYSTWVSMMIRNISNNHIRKLYQDYPDIFEALIEYENVREYDIQEMAKKLGKCCSHKEYMSFRDMVLVKKGIIEGIDSCYEVTSENYPTQLLFDGESVKIELDYPEINDSSQKGSNDFIDISLHLLTTKKVQNVSSVRIASFKVNDKELIDDFGCWEFNDTPNVGYKVKDVNNKDEVTMYEGCLKKRHIKRVKKIELQFVCKHGRKIVETTSPVIIEYDEQLEEYRVTKEAQKQE